MYLVLIPSSNKTIGTIYELLTYNRARYFAQKHALLGAKYLRKSKKLENYDLFCDHAQIRGYKIYKRKKIEN